MWVGLIFGPSFCDFGYHFGVSGGIDARWVEMVGYDRLDREGELPEVYSNKNTIESREGRVACRKGDVNMSLVR